MAFAIDRNEAARRLSMSTRTVDRHIQSWRIRTRRIWKKTFLHEEDVEALRTALGTGDGEEYIVVDRGDREEPEIVHREKKVALKQEGGIDFSTLYREAQEIIVKKDEIIQDLAYRLGKSETELTHSIPMVEYKKATFLLESAKNKTDTDAQSLTSKISILEKEVEKRNSQIAGLMFLFILVLAFSVIFFLYTWGYFLGANPSL
jgi:ABC-type Na+ efflux pump permease subunit